MAKRTTKELNIYSPIEEFPGIGPKKKELLSKLGINTGFDMLTLMPRSYEDYRNIKDIAALENGDKALVKARVLKITRGRGYGRKAPLHLSVSDHTGIMSIVFFMGGFMMNVFKVGEEYTFYGKVKKENGHITMFHPAYAKYDEDNMSILPVYPLTKGLSQKDLRKLSKEVIELIDTLEETLPLEVVTRNSLCSNKLAYSNIHYPDDENEYRKSRYRLIFEEFFYLKTALSMSKDRNTKEDGLYIKSGKAEEFINKLPYKLTNAQLNAVNDILNDMRSFKSMNRLVQGDVGSGKTVVAMSAICEAVFAGFQCIFMAPTEILANQHFNTLNSYFKDLDIEAVLLTSSMKAAEKRDALSKLKDGTAMVAIGTHALISDSVEYKNAGLVITDEQHRFGVNQRKKLAGKGKNPDILIMTATPIPRTLAVVLYADLDVSIINELPPGRKPIKTMSFKDKERKDAYKLLLSEVSKGRQGYIVAPFIEDSETIEGRSAVSLYEAFKKKHPEIKAGLLHGDMKDSEKDEVMLSFKNNEISILFCTVVIEVGIDVPNASVMLIENSERFGLAQMHQLRGRVGRGEFESYCLLCIGEETEIAMQRAKTLCENADGFVIAEKDLEMRGPGEFFGLRQHGLPEFSLADPVKHFEIAAKAQDEVNRLLTFDPGLNEEENQNFRENLEKKFLQVDNLTI